MAQKLWSIFLQENFLKKSLLIGFFKSAFFGGKSMLQKMRPISNESAFSKKKSAKSRFF